MLSRVRPFTADAGFSMVELLMVIAIIGVLAAIALPMTGNAIRFQKISGDARNISNDIAVAKMRAAAKFTQARLYFDFSAKNYFVQTCDTPSTSPCPSWTTEGGLTLLSSTVSFGFGSVSSSSPPPLTQTTLSQAALCKNNASPPVDVANTACIIFNSRGIPVDAGNSPIGTYAIYINDGTFVYGSTIATAGFTKNWRTSNTSTPTWVLQ